MRNNKFSIVLIVCAVLASIGFIARTVVNVGTDIDHYALSGQIYDALLVFSLVQTAVLVLIVFLLLFLILRDSEFSLFQKKTKTVKVKVPEQTGEPEEIVVPEEPEPKKKLKTKQAQKKEELEQWKHFYREANKK